MATIMDLKATSESSFNIGISSNAIKLKNSSGELHIKNKTDTAYLAVMAERLFLNNDFLEFNSNASLSGADWIMELKRPSTGMTANVSYTLPASPINGYYLTTDGSGNLSWAAVSSPSVTEKVTVDSTDFDFNDFGGPLSMFTLPAQAVVHRVEIIVDSAFDAGDIQIAGTNTLASSAQSDLTDAARFVVEPNYAALVGTDAISASFTGSPTVGSGRILVHYSIPA